MEIILISAMAKMKKNVFSNWRNSIMLGRAGD
jgi:hypothetical protein